MTYIDFYLAPVLFRNELRQLLESAGFQVLDEFRDYNRNPYDGTGELLVVARRP